MRDVTQCLLDKFGDQQSSAINLIVSKWCSYSFRLFDMTISLNNINEVALLRALEYAIDEYGLAINDMREIALVPALADNKCDVQVRVFALPAVLARKLASFIDVEYGFWTDKDQFTFHGSTEHIEVVKGDDSDNIIGMYLNGTVIDGGEKISTYFTSNELNGVFKNIDSALNGVQITSVDQKRAIALRGLFYRLIDSDIGFMLSQEHEETYDLVNTMVTLGNDIDEPQELNHMIFSSWGETIGAAFKKYDITDVHKAKAQTESPNKKHLSVVVDNAVKPSPLVDELGSAEEEELEWGKF